jgi:hypothetical protein
MFVIECFVPDLARFDHDQRVQARSVTEDSAVIEVSVHDKVRLRVDTQMITLDGQGMHLRPVAIRCSWPAELGRPAAGRALRRLGPAAVHFGQRRPRLGLSASLTTSDEPASPTRQESKRRGDRMTGRCGATDALAISR